MGILVLLLHSVPTACRMLLYSGSNFSSSNFSSLVNRSCGKCQKRVFVAMPARSNWVVSLLMDQCKFVWHHLPFLYSHCEDAVKDCRTSCGLILSNYSLHSISVRDCAPFRAMKWNHPDICIGTLKFMCNFIFEVDGAYTYTHTPLGCTTRTRTAVNPQSQGAVKNALSLKTCARQGSNPLDRKCTTIENFTL